MEQEVQSIQDSLRATESISTPFDSIWTGGDVPTVAPSELDAVIVRGIVYGCDGSRIGTEDQAYDSFLEEVRCPRIAPAFEPLQLSSRLDGVEGVSRVDLIISETASYGSAHRKERRP